MDQSPFNFHAVKIVFFFEVEPLSDRFEQIMLNPDARKRVLDALEREMPPNGKGGFTVTTNDDFTYSFPNIPDDYLQEKIDADGL